MVSQLRYIWSQKFGCQCQFFFFSQSPAFTLKGRAYKYQKTKRNSSNILFCNSKTSLVCLWYFGFFKTGILIPRHCLHSTFCPSEYCLRSWTIVILVRNTKLIIFFKQLFLSSSLRVGGTVWVGSVLLWSQYLS